MSGSNFVERYAAWADSFMDAPRQFHRFIAYWTLSTLLGRRVYMCLGDAWLFPNLWLIVVAPSSFFRKSTALNLGRDMVEGVKENMISSDGWSYECLVSILSQQPHTAMVYTEVSGLMDQLQKDYNSGAKALLTDLYDCPAKYSRKKGVDVIKEFRIERPYLTVLGASTIDWLIDSVKGRDISGGFLARFLFVSADKKDKIVAIQPKADQREKENLKNMLTNHIQVEGEMSYTPEARKHYERWYMDFVKEAESAPDTIRAFFPRLTSYAHKFAMLEAILNGHFPNVTEGDCRNACLIAYEFAAEIRQLGAESLGKTWFETQKIRILKAIKKHEGIDHSRLLKNSNLDAKKFSGIIETLKQSAER